MKKSLTGVVALLAGAFVAHSQGTVAFGNYTAFSSPNYMYVSLGSTKLGGTATGPAGTQGNYAAETGNGTEWSVALYGAAGSGDAGSTLAPLNTALTGGVPVVATLADGSSDGVVGTWYSGASGVVPSTTGDGAAATVQVYAWYNAGGTLTSYAAAKTAGVPTGFSATGNVTLGGPQTGAPPALPAAMPQLGNIGLTASVVPEPSTIALGIMGASAFLLRLRKKQ
jgi:hypothetical protein